MFEESASRPSWFLHGVDKAKDSQQEIEDQAHLSDENSIPPTKALDSFLNIRVRGNKALDELPAISKKTRHGLQQYNQRKKKHIS